MKLYIYTFADGQRIGVAANSPGEADEKLKNHLRHQGEETCGTA